MKNKKILYLILSVVSLAIVQPAIAAQEAAEHKTDKKSGWDAYSMLQSGNMRFYEGQAKHPKQAPSYREALADGQKPHSIIISCSDSRVPPETVFDQGLGEVFTIRLAGHVLNADAIASAEYAVEHLGPKFLLVMGHESCGAVKAAIATKPGSSAGSPSLDELVAKIRPNIEKQMKMLTAEEKLYRAPVKAHVTATIKDLLDRSAIIRSAVEKKELLVGSAIYNLRSGHVEFWDIGAKDLVHSAKTPEQEALSQGEGTKVAEHVVETESLTLDAGRKKNSKHH